MLTRCRPFIAGLLWIVPFTAAGQGERPAPLKVLFIGNSYTAANDLPAMLEGLADAAAGRKIHTDRHLVGGCTLERHFEEKKAVDKIRSESWDVVVLQEQSLRPVLDRRKMHKYARLLDAEIKRQGATTVFYLTWARQHIPDMQEGADPAASPEYARAMYQFSGAAKTTDFETWCQQQKAGLVGGLNGAYFDVARELGAEVAPVGIAWKMALASDPPLVLHRPDKSHPNSAGTYLAACVFYAALLDKSPVGLPNDVKRGDKVLVSIPGDVAKRLQESAWAAVEVAAKSTTGQAAGHEADISISVNAQSLTRLPSQWPEYFGTHYAGSPEGAGRWWNTVRSYGGTQQARRRPGPACLVGRWDSQTRRFRAGCRATVGRVPVGKVTLLP